MARSLGGTTQRKEMRRMRRMDNVEARQACFSRRIRRLFEKAGELSVLCGSPVGIIVFSPGGKVFSFGHPNLETVLDRFQRPENYVGVPLPSALTEASSSTSTSLQRQQEIHNSLLAEVIAARRRLYDLKAQFKATHRQNRFGFLWECDVKELDAEKVGEFVAAMDELSSALEKQIMAANGEASIDHGYQNDDPPPAGGTSGGGSGHGGNVN